MFTIENPKYNNEKEMNMEENHTQSNICIANIRYGTVWYVLFCIQGKIEEIENNIRNYNGN